MSVVSAMSVVSVLVCPKGYVCNVCYGFCVCMGMPNRLCIMYLIIGTFYSGESLVYTWAKMRFSEITQLVFYSGVQNYSICYSA